MTDSRLMRVRAVTMRYCPVDRVLGVPMYSAPCRFSRGGFRETLAAGYWPTGSIFDYALDYRGDVTRWLVSGCYLLELGTERVACASLKGDGHVQVRLVEAASAVKGDEMSWKPKPLVLALIAVLSACVVGYVSAAIYEHPLFLIAAVEVTAVLVLLFWLLWSDRGVTR